MKGGLQGGWHTEKLGNVCSFLNRGVSPKYLEVGGVCVLNQKCIRDHRISYTQARRHDTGAKSISDARFIQLGDVLVNSTGTGTLGRVAQLREVPPEPTTVDSHVTIVRPKPNKFFPDFFGYMLILIEEAIKEAGEGCGGQTELARSVLAEKFSVSYPTSITEQQRIVGVLDEAFDGIATAKINAVKNLQNARDIFDSKLQSVFERRPGEVLLSELATDITDGDHMPPPKAPSGVPFITISDIVKHTREIDFSDTFAVPEDYYRKLKSNKKPKVGDILYTVTGATLGIPVLVKDPRDFCFQRHIGLVRPKPDIDSSWLCYALLSPQVFRQATLGSTGTAQKTVSLNVLRRLKLPKMGLPEQKLVASQLDGLVAETQHLQSIYQQKVAALHELKRSLLDQAFRGEL